MGRFWQDAQRIFETAANGPADTSADWMILQGNDGGLHCLAGPGWSLETAIQHHGARTAYHVTREKGIVKVEARSGSSACVLQGTAARVPHLRDQPRYLLA